MRTLLALSFWLFAASFAAAATPPPDPCTSQPRDHVSDRACQQLNVDKTMKLVAQAEDRVRAAIRNWDEDQNWKDSSLKLFELSVTAFRAYRSALCEVDASSTAGGNGAGDMRLYCEEGLAKERLKYLARQEKHFGG